MVTLIISIVLFLNKCKVQNYQGIPFYLHGSKLMTGALKSFAGYDPDTGMKGVFLVSLK
jgi:hypothetical protein